MIIKQLEPCDFPELWELQKSYKAEIGEEPPTQEDAEALLCAIRGGNILFYGIREDGVLAGCCSISRIFSTFNYAPAGVLEDLYLLPAYRHRGLARRLITFAARESGVRSMTVGAAGCDLPMYSALGFSIPLGTMLAYDSIE